MANKYTITVWFKDNVKALSAAIRSGAKALGEISKSAKAVSAQTTKEFGKIGEDVSKLVPPDFYNRFESMRKMFSSLGDDVEGVGGNIRRTGNELKSMRIVLQGVRHDSEATVNAFQIFKDQLADVKDAKFGVESLTEVSEATGKIKNLSVLTMKTMATTKQAVSATTLWGIAFKTLGQIALNTLKLIWNGIKRAIVFIKNAITAIAKLAISIGKTLFNAAQKAVTVIGKIAKSIISIPLAPLRNLASSFRNIGTIIAGMVGYGGLKSLGRQISSFVEEMGPVQSVRVMFENFMQQATHNVEGFNASADDMIKQMRDITKGALDTTQMLKNANLAFSLIGDTVGKELPKMLGIAQAASLATGESIERMFSSLVKGVGRLSTRWLDNLGITLSTTEEYDRYGATIDKVAGDLTHAERVQALLNGAMREGEKIMLRTGNTSAFLATQMSALGTTLTNTRDSIISNFAPIFTVILEEINDFAEKSQRRIDQWTRGFTDGFARMPEFAYKLVQDLDNTFGGIPQIVRENFREGHEQMGFEAGQWAANALGWGANVGANFAIGILNGFTNLFIMVVNAIAAAITHFFGPGSPPLVAPKIDVWGYETMEEWVKGMLSYPISSDIGALKKELADVFEGGVKDELFQWGADALESWTKGLSILDLEFLTKIVEKALNKAKKLNEALNKTYKKQNTELFKMQVLNKDPAAIRAQLSKVKNTKLSLRTNEAELKQLEDRKDLIQEQLDIMRLMKRALDKMEASRAAKKAKGGAGAGELGDLGLPDILEPLAGTSKLENLLEGIRETFLEALEEPIKRIKKAWEIDIGIMKNVWARFLETLGESKPEMVKVFEDIKQSAINTFNFVRGMLAGLFGIGVNPMAGVDTSDLGAVQEAWAKWEGTHPESFYEGIDFAVKIKEVFQDISDAITTGVDLVKTAWSKFRVFLFGAFGGAEPIGMPEGLRSQIEGDFGPGLVSMFSDMATDVKPYIDKMVESILSLGDAIVDLFNAMSGGDIIQTTITGIGIASGAAATLVTGLATGLERLIRALETFQEGKQLKEEGDWLGAQRKKFKGVGQIISAPFAGLTPVLENIFDSFNPLADLVDKVRGIGEDVVAGFNRGVEDNIGESVNAATDWAQAVENASREQLGAESPSSIFEAIGEDVVDGFIAGIKDNEIRAKVTIYHFMSEIIKAARISVGAVTMGTPSTVFNQIANDIVLGLKSGFEEDRVLFMEFIYDFMDEAVWTAHGVAANAYSVGKAFSGGIEAGIRDGIDGIIEAAQDAAYAALHGARRESDTESPSKKFKELGMDMIEGLNQGLRTPVIMPSVLAGARAGAGAGGNTTIVHIHGPIVGSIAVPNAAAGRKTARIISNEISSMAMLKRKPY